MLILFSVVGVGLLILIAVTAFHFWRIWRGGGLKPVHMLPERVEIKDQLSSTAIVSALKSDQDPEYKAKVVRLSDRMLAAKKAKR